MTTKKQATRKRAPKTKAKKAAAKAPAKAPAENAHGLKAGQLIERRYKGRDLRLQVTANGFLFDGTEYASLTAAAKAATKYPSISGVVFWLQPARKAAANAPAKDGGKGGAA